MQAASRSRSPERWPLLAWISLSWSWWSIATCNLDHDILSSCSPYAPALHPPAPPLNWAPEYFNNVKHYFFVRLPSSLLSAIMSSSWISPLTGAQLKLVLLKQSRSWFWGEGTWQRQGGTLGRWKTSWSWWRWSWSWWRTMLARSVGQSCTQNSVSSPIWAPVCKCFLKQQLCDSSPFQVLQRNWSSNCNTLYMYCTQCAIINYLSIPYPQHHNHHDHCFHHHHDFDDHDHDRDIHLILKCSMSWWTHPVAIWAQLGRHPWYYIITLKRSKSEKLSTAIIAIINVITYSCADF